MGSIEDDRIRYKNKGHVDHFFVMLNLLMKLKVIRYYWVSHHTPTDTIYSAIVERPR